MQATSLLLLAFIAYVGCLAVLMYQGRPASKQEGSRGKPVQPSSTPSSDQPFALDVAYHHRLTVPDEYASRSLTESLRRRGIQPQTIRDGEQLQVVFTSEKKLENVEQLKKRKILLDYDIKGVTA